MNGGSGSIMVNWSDETYRKPANILKIIRDWRSHHCRQTCLQSVFEKGGCGDSFEKGWTTRYITDFAENVRFYLRGNEFTRQLDYFVDCVERRAGENISSFAEALKTDIIMDEITRDAARSIAQTNADRVNLFCRESRAEIRWWTKLFRTKERNRCWIGSFLETISFLGLTTCRKTKRRPLRRNSRT